MPSFTMELKKVESMFTAKKYNEVSKIVKVKLLNIVRLGNYSFVGRKWLQFPYLRQT